MQLTTDKMKILITGAGGLLGRHITAALQPHHTLSPFSRRELDITQADAVQSAFNRERPEVVINCAAMTGVDACELDPAVAFLHNAEGPRRLALACRDVGIRLVHISTDYVFDGARAEGYAPDDVPHPISVYGASKLQGEIHVRETLECHCIVRVSGLYGNGGRNFASTLAAILEKAGTVRAVADNRILPGYAPDVARRLGDLVEGNHSGTYHATNSGVPCSWYEFARFGGQILGTRVQAELIPVKESELNRPAARPVNSTLACSASERLGLPTLRDWHEALTAHLSQPSFEF